jgi:UDP-glucose 4-epimerase
VVDGYIDAGHQVVVVDNLSTGKERNINSAATFYKADIRAQGMGDIMRKEMPDMLNHHAAQISVPVSVSDPLLDADINIKGFLNLLEWAVKCKVKKCIFISSGGAIYGEADEYPTPEGYAPRPLSPYAVSKYSSEHYLAYYKHQHGLKYTTLRYANIYGPRQIPHGEAGVVAIFMNNLLQNRSSVLYHFPEDEGGMVRDYCYVGDVVSSNIEALHKGEGTCFNIGSGKGTKTLELYGVIYEAVKEMRPDLPPTLAVPQKKEARPGDIRRSCLVVDKALSGLGWRPRKDLAEGIRLTLAWWQEQAA